MTMGVYGNANKTVYDVAREMLEYYAYDDDMELYRKLSDDEVVLDYMQDCIYEVMEVMFDAGNEKAHRIMENKFGKAMKVIEKEIEGQ